MLMLLGYGVIAVPTGIVSSELARTRSTKGNGRTCPSCSIIIEDEDEDEDEDANYCKNCGQELEH